MTIDESNVDSALLLKKYVRDKRMLEVSEIQKLLENSEVITKILAEPYRTDTFTGLRKLEFLLIELSEIPYFEGLEQVQTMLETLHSYTNYAEGFSLTGKQSGVLACHNAICTLIFLRAGKKEWAEKGIQWIISYFPFDKNIASNWHGKDLFHRFGGCVGNSPCYDGLVKSVKALSEYTAKYGDYPELQIKLQQGLDYILAHRVIFHQNSDEYLYDDLITLFYPYPYRTNIIEALGVMKTEDLLDCAECQAALDYLKEKHQDNGFWKSEKIFMKSSWIPFDPIKKPGAWITDEIEWLLE
ncbi:hypothetical protein [Enterococcus malodoratus]|uniref:hypothetical protein n=1 Tax=Enterococcus malodoratus TaxID=71451 RepID=UPI0039B0F969